MRVVSTAEGPRLEGNINKAVQERCDELGYVAVGSGRLTRSLILYADQETHDGIGTMAMLDPTIPECIQLIAMLSIALQHLVDIGDPVGLKIRDVLAEFDEAVGKASEKPMTLEEILDEKH